MKKENGITLVALVITIIILLILSGVTITTLTGDNGLLIKSKSAVNNYSEGEIKERIMLAVTNARMKNMSLLDRTVLDNELKSEFGEGNYELLPVGEGFLIAVNNVEYLVDKDGKVNDGNKIEESNIEYAGDLSKAGQYDGTTEDNAYRITCIEDLVEWSNNPNKYSSKNIKLENTIDFNSTASYNNARAKTTDINGNGTAEALITELTTGTGFKPISGFSGTFDGQNNEIRNIYENTTGNVGLFSNPTNAVPIIRNIGISGSIISNNGYAGAIMGKGISGIKLINCYSKANVHGTRSSGGLIGNIYAGDAGSVYFYNCYNSGNVIADSEYAGGLMGEQSGNTNIFINCFNIGSVKGEVSGGILGLGKRASFINIYNSGKIENTSEYKPAGIGGHIRFGHEFINTKFLNDLTLAVTRYQWSAVYTTSTLPSSSKSEIQSQEFVNELNTYLDTYNEEHKNDDGFIELKRWKYTEGNYPTFE